MPVPTSEAFVTTSWPDSFSWPDIVGHIQSTKVPVRAAWSLLSRERPGGYILQSPRFPECNFPGHRQGSRTQLVPLRQETLNATDYCYARRSHQFSAAHAADPEASGGSLQRSLVYAL